MPEQANKNDEIKEKISLLSRNPKLVETTRGQLQVRHLAIKDSKTFAKILDKGDAATSDDFEQLGMLSLLTLVSAAGDMEFAPVLSKETIESLKAEDVVLLIQAVAQTYNIEGYSSLNTFEALGKVLFDNLLRVKTQIADNAAAIQRAITGSFRTLPDSLKFDLGHRFSELSAVRHALGSSVAVAAIGQTQQPRIAMLGRVADTFKIPVDRSNISFEQTSAIRALVPPKFEETAAGRTAARGASASEDAAKQLREVAGIMGTMAEQMAALQDVFLRDVLPKWNADLQESANATNSTLRQAESSLFWAKWALVASVVVGVMMTAWQVWQAREHKLESDKQQERSEQLMTDQLTAVVELNKQLTKQSQQNSETKSAAKRSAAAKREAGPADTRP